MLNYSILSKKPAYFRNFSGVELTEFNTYYYLLPPAYPE
jgi:hypothetical protein